ncbi:putative E3 ubiquitin-protein ligase RHB1A [Cinnamomum micranthum f. kanehirae]|uniref:RING-type E3 ubiquitin transferase n=1 Tax=Cinnamomum micranthum f. kanehirae TaxID=337451 RepID=A0A3S3NGF1_9MAGN|nr:putative E3 ubiquitin-protein ligase RHB1A [Cinnamomum micranthum f. kanehirae]
MGGCCCSSRAGRLNEQPVYFYCPRYPEERGSLSTHATDSALSTGLLIGTNPDTYPAPPVPLPYEVDLGQPRALSGLLENNGNKIGPVLAADSQSVGQAISDGGLKSSVTYDDLKLDGKNQTDDLQGSPKVAEDEPSKLSECLAKETNEEDVCPTCLEEYDAENPRIITKCDHHFHLSCILEWMERSDTCPICDQEMVFDHNFSK